MTNVMQYTGSGGTILGISRILSTLPGPNLVYAHISVGTVEVGQVRSFVAYSYPIYTTGSFLE